MRHIKMFGLAALAAVAAMAFVGASSVMASENTAFCSVHEEPCAAAHLVSHIHMEASDLKLLNSTANILCSSSLALVDVLKDASTGTYLAEAPTPLKAKVTELTWTNCKTEGNGTNNCTVTNITLPEFDALKTALNLGTAKALGPEVLVKCTILGFIKIHCVYGGAEVGTFGLEGAGHNGGAAGHGMFTANALSVPFVSGTNCPSTSNWDALYEPLTDLFITG
jgi:hypothetical protein